MLRSRLSGLRRVFSSLVEVASRMQSSQRSKSRKRNIPPQTLSLSDCRVGSDQRRFLVGRLIRVLSLLEFRSRCFGSFHRLRHSKLYSFPIPMSLRNSRTHHTTSRTKRRTSLGQFCFFSFLISFFFFLFISLEIPSPSRRIGVLSAQTAFSSFLVFSPILLSWACLSFSCFGSQSYWLVLEVVV